MGPEFRRVCPPRLVEVLEGDVWRLAQLEGWQLGVQGCRASVRYRVEQGRTSSPLVWVTEARVRPRRIGQR